MIDDKADAPPSGDGDAGTEKVGFGKPPKATRFPRGHSGNQKGRPPGAKGHKAIVKEIAGELHRVTEGGRTRWCSTLELILLSLRNRAAAADVKAFKAYTDLQARFAPPDSTDERYVARHLPLACLSPAIIDAILDGRQPIELTTWDLLNRIEIPLNWDDQARRLGCC